MMPFRASLAFGLGRDLLFAVVACATAVMVSLSVQLDMTKQELRERSLATAARAVADQLVTDANGSVDLSVSSASAAKVSGYPTLVFDHEGRLVYERPKGLEPALIAALASESLGPAEQPRQVGAIRFFQLAYHYRLVDGAVLHAGSGDDARSVTVFKDESSPDVLIDDIVREFPYRSTRMLLPLFALLLFGSGCIIWFRMRPIAEVSAIAETIGPHTLDVRLPERKLPAELLPIVRGVNGAFERLEQAAEVQREFLRSAAHQLRTPMTVLSARAEALDDSKTAEKLRGDIKELSRIVSQLLQLNELDALPDTGDALADLGAVAEAVRDEFAPRAERNETPIVLTTPPEPVLVRGDPNVIEIAVRNLVENALAHSPAGSTIELRVTADGCLAVADAGPGVPDALHDRIFEPFWSDGQSAGLGLTIVGRIAERYGAGVSLELAPGGGAIFILRFRPATTGTRALDPAALRATLPVGLARRRRVPLQSVSD
jgi:signal transduction histidine kinase